MSSIKHAVTAMAAALCIAPAWAATSVADLARIGKDLTPVGAEVAANKDASIPAWTGGLTAPPAGWSAEQGYVDPFAGEKPLFTISKDNVAQHKDKLSPGLQALLAKYPEFRMPVYPSHRTAAYPKSVTDAAAAQAGKVQLKQFSIDDLGDSTIPFLAPKSGIEVILNHNFRYLGGGLKRTYNWFPVRASGEFYKVGYRETRIFNPNMDKQADNRLLNFLGAFTSPATLEGTVQLVQEPADQVKEARSAWIYNAGQRRVRRAPDLAYDNVNDGTEGLRTTDQYDGYNGAPDRYDWKLIGKQEMYVAYNTYRAGSKATKYKDLVLPHTVNADLMRYELHRVWVVEATLKPGSKHIYAKRRFYVDEDSWSVLLEDAYDSRGELWRASVHGLIQYYDAGVPWYNISVYHDLSNGAYLAASLANEVKDPWQFGVKGREIDFQSDSLRRAGTK